VLFFKQFDSDPNQPARFTFHSSFCDPTSSASLPPRESIEVRAMAIFLEEPTPGEMSSRQSSAIQQHTWPVVRAALSENISLERSPAFTLQSRLAARAGRSLLAVSEVERIADWAALNNVADDEVLQKLRTDLRETGRSNAEGLPREQLSAGSYSESVRQLQFVLIELGMLDYSVIKHGAGMYGPQTNAAVKYLQRALQMPTTGVYDNAVRTQLLKMLEA